MLIELDRTRTVAGWVVAVVLLGQSAGPLIGSLTVNSGNVLPAFAAAALLTSMAAIAYVFAAPGRRRTKGSIQSA
jgi:predicted MFS family arabinose efflux permease